MLLLAALALVGVAWAGVAVPPLSGRVVDLTGALTPSERSELEGGLAAFEREKGSQIAVLVVPTTEPETIEQYSIRVAEAWKLGRKGIDDGAILVVAKQDRTVRIEVGYGLEGVLTDATSKRIIEDIVVPKFRSGDFFGGIRAGTEAIENVVRGEPLPTPAWRSSRGSGDGVTNVVPAIFGLFLFGGALATVLGTFLAALVVGLVSAALGWYLVNDAAVAGFCGLLGFGLTLFRGVAGPRFPVGVGGRGFGGGGGFSGGGRSGGGFSGGGGGFGGGGASGRW